MKLRKIAAAALAALMLSACGTKNGSDTDTTTAADVSESETTTAVVTESVIREMKDVTAAELAAGMTVGWNVGNSLDSVGTGLSSETAWGNPKISKELIDAVNDAGFNVLRIPVTWQGHFGEAPDYTIDEEWLGRVKEVVDYALANDMYAIINIHHDGNDTDTSWLTPEPSDEEAMVAQFAKLWEQIAAYFEEYDERLLFAGMNEFHRGYGNPTDGYLALTDRLNQKFVDTVRASGGNNEKRILIVQAYNTNAYHAMKMTIPTDTASNKLMMEFHYYDPWNFAGEGKGEWGMNSEKANGRSHEDAADKIFDKIKTQFVDNGIPVIIGEYGATRNKQGHDDHRRYYIEYITKAAKERGLIPVYWDNGNDGYSGEAFALFYRGIGTKRLHEDIIDGMMRAASGEDYEIVLPAPTVVEEETEEASDEAA